MTIIVLIGAAIFTVVGYISNLYSIPKLEHRFYAGLSDGDYNRKIELRGWLPFLLTGYYIRHRDGDPPVTTEIGSIVVFETTYFTLYDRNM